MSKNLYFSLIGIAPLCNMRRDRGVIINNCCLPLCQRCLSIVLGLITSYAFFSDIFKNSSVSALTALFLVLQTPMLIDGLFQYALKKESTPLRRFCSGMLSGLGLSLFYKAINFSLKMTIFGGNIHTFSINNTCDGKLLTFFKTC